MFEGKEGPPASGQGRGTASYRDTGLANKAAVCDSVLLTSLKNKLGTISTHYAWQARLSFSRRLSHYH